jgi:hypothetical protein
MIVTFQGPGKAWFSAIVAQIKWGDNKGASRTSPWQAPCL